MAECIFCQISSQKVPCYQVAADGQWLAFLDIFPHAVGHTVIIPREHRQTFFDLTLEERASLGEFTRQVMEKLQTVLSPAGYNVGWNQGEVAGQAVPHFHVHVMPRYEGDGGGSLHSIIKNPGVKTVAEIAQLFS
ncbi:MAG TPA: HIT family protein [Patescibacteria group bacterium]|nr:HIT family protein [Patescibacteria group bacterium]